MNKKDLIPVIALAMLIPLWMYVDRTFIAPKYPTKTPAAAEQTTDPSATPVPASAPLSGAYFPADTDPPTSKN